MTDHTSPLSVYSLAIMPDTEISERVRDLKQRLQTKIGKSYGSAKADPHISLDSFEADAAHYPHILAEYTRILRQQPSFRIDFSGYGHFEGYYPAFYIRLTPTSEEAVRSCYKAVRSAFDKPLKKQYMHKWQNECRTPHMTIGRRLTPEWIELAYSLFPAFEESFECGAFAIRKFNGRQYDVVDEILLGGNAAPAGEQLRFL